MIVRNPGGICRVYGVERPDLNTKQACEDEPGGSWYPDPSGRPEFVCVIEGVIDESIATKKECREKGGDWVPRSRAPSAARAGGNRSGAKKSRRRRPGTKARKRPGTKVRKRPGTKARKRTKRKAGKSSGKKKRSR